MHGRRAFTLIELLVVVAIIALLISILLPSLSAAREQSRRVVCGTNQHQIGIAATSYAMENNGEYIICVGRAVQNAFTIPERGNSHYNHPDDKKVDWVAQWAKMGMMGQVKEEVVPGKYHYPPSKIWNCPSRGYETQWEGWPSLIIGYQYFGGIEYWENADKPKMRSASPVDMDNAMPDWVLAADTTMKIDGSWGGGRATAYGGMPSHRYDNWEPIGHNQLYVDGSVSWVPFEQMIYIHSWTNNWSRVAFFYQRDLRGWVPPASHLAENH